MLRSPGNQGAHSEDWNSCNVLFLSSSHSRRQQVISCFPAFLCYGLRPKSTSWDASWSSLTYPLVHQNLLTCASNQRYSARIISVCSRCSPYSYLYTQSQLVQNSPLDALPCLASGQIKYFCLKKKNPDLFSYSTAQLPPSEFWYLRGGWKNKMQI